MLRFFLLLTLISSLLFAKDNYEQKLYENILPKVFHKNSVHIFITDDETKKVLNNSTILKIVQECNDADIVIGNSFNQESANCKKKPSFALDYRAYKHSQSAIGAFYWRKGRPQIAFSKKSFKKYKLTIPQSLQKYVQ